MNNTTSPKKRPNYAPEVRQRAVRIVLDHQGDYPSRWAAIDSVAKKIGCERHGREDEGSGTREPRTAPGQ